MSDDLMAGEEMMETHEAQPAPAKAEPRVLLTPRTALATLERPLADALEASMDKLSKLLLEQTGADRTDAEMLLRVGKRMLVGMRKDIAALEKPESKLVSIK
jgi:hypothetical protein